MYSSTGVYNMFFYTEQRWWLLITQKKYEGSRVEPECSRLQWVLVIKTKFVCKESGQLYLLKKKNSL